jgi:hypothetical protein
LTAAILFRTVRAQLVAMRSRRLARPALIRAIEAGAIRRRTIGNGPIKGRALAIPAVLTLSPPQRIAVWR